MVDSLKALKPATEALYAALSEEQKKKADKLLGDGCRHEVRPFSTP